MRKTNVISEIITRVLERKSNTLQRPHLRLRNSNLEPISDLEGKK